MFQKIKGLILLDNLAENGGEIMIDDEPRLFENKNKGGRRNKDEYEG